ncbi:MULTISPECIES: hypothetical protein [Dyella]|uniref:Uncharacterized protein n=2 Tax=Dyella TaxID=231454 RepID=A0A4V2NMG3_9GAMM|nr:MULTISPECIES: hypothetical protein [Dyella]TBR39265.1 hypothetical protein EYV96_03295 [Dyella terrae]TCI13147.1 hypothetical protein EZM97_07570 [Dyella soli]
MNPSPDLYEIVPGVHLRKDKRPNPIDSPEGLTHVVGLLSDVLDGFCERKSVTVHLLPRKYTDSDGAEAVLPPGYRIFALYERREQKILEYRIDCIEPHCAAHKPQLALLQEACTSKGIDITSISRNRDGLCDALISRRWSRNLLASLKQSPPRRRDIQSDWPDGKCGVTHADGVRGIELHDLIVVDVREVAGDLETVTG